VSRRWAASAAGGVLTALIAAALMLRLAAPETAVSRTLAVVAVFALALGMVAVGVWSLYTAIAGVRAMVSMVRRARPVAPDSPEGARVWLALRAAGISEKLASVDVLISDAPASMAITIPGCRQKLIFARELVGRASEDGLVGVAGHEYSHLHQPPVNTFVVGAGVGAIGSAGALIGVWASGLAAAGMMLVVLAVSRRMELDADRRACMLLGSTGPVQTSLEEMREAASPRWASVLSTHPPKHERIAAVEQLRQRWDERPRRGAGDTSARER